MMRARNNSSVEGFTPKASDHASDEYAALVAVPTMRAIDGMPSEYRALVQEFGYIDVYRAWRQGWSCAQIRARSPDGLLFKLGR